MADKFFLIRDQIDFLKEVRKAWPKLMDAMNRVLKMNGDGVSNTTSGITISNRQPRPRPSTPAPAASGGGTEWVAVTQVGGSAGSVSTACTFTYSFTDASGFHASVSPEMQRSTKGKMVAGLIGCTNGAGALKYVDEVPDRGCGTLCP